MQYKVLACDYDGTLAHDGHVDAPARAALERFTAAGGTLILVTGRELEELFSIFPDVYRFAAVVGENGGLIYRPATRETKVLCDPPAKTFVDELQRRGVAPLRTGHVIIATWRPNETTVLEVIRDQGLEMQVIFNKDAVMVLPSGVNKATGLATALKDLGFTEHDVVGVGDAENDHAFLSLCERAVAVANALPALKEHADLVTEGARGAGVIELIDRLLRDEAIPKRTPAATTASKT